MASRYAPKGKEDLYGELCRVITGEQETGEDVWRKAIYLVRRGTASCELVGADALSLAQVVYPI